MCEYPLKRLRAGAIAFREMDRKLYLYRVQSGSRRELRHELVDAAALFGSLQGHAPHDGELVLCSVRELVPQEFGMLLTAL